MPSENIRLGAMVPTTAGGGSPKLDGVPRDEYVALCRLAQSHPTEYDALLVDLTNPLGPDEAGSA